MTAYIIGRIDVTNANGYMAYAEQTVALAEKWGGRFLVKGGAPQQLEGSGPGRIVVIAFPDRARAEGWYASEAYQAILPIALENSLRDIVIVDGVEELE